MVSRARSSRTIGSLLLTTASRELCWPADDELHSNFCIHISEFSDFQRLSGALHTHTRLKTEQANSEDRLTHTRSDRRGRVL